MTTYRTPTRETVKVGDFLLSSSVKYLSGTVSQLTEMGVIVNSFSEHIHLESCPQEVPYDDLILFVILTT